MEFRVKSWMTALALFLVQITFVPLISVGGFTPDLLIPWLLYVGIRQGQMEATLSGFAIGLVQDAATSQFFGLAALAKCSAGFASGYFFNENTAEQTLGSYRFLLAILIISLVHNVIYYGIFFQGMDQSVFMATLRTGIGTAIYTGVIGILPMFAFSQKYHTSWAQ
ncbi:MAG: rod shape-determining protein MreD [Ignavibacteria bacterium RIFCSPLOWO2_02_FULL_55_14]|nr:MAG: rod shape-determining protein MreD [Ignavibacteria bacterium RIFCSPHIGHO2_02_FULL_56_12]OGU72506.1 MAG: rod shape-determining protein MreD [Ignavibacteria bacterium RIFCSPLOWO2_02_FULL_55_14]OGU72916.1 MAG: rod shape-determining protein MreD [Ignavibacteria bacterium RIFCSPLOWO2_12_FULL_56_21]